MIENWTLGFGSMPECKLPLATAKLVVFLSKVVALLEVAYVNFKLNENLK